jgi:hypothetical protein
LNSFYREVIKTMPLFAKNLTPSPVVLTGISVTLPPNNGGHGPKVNVTSELKSLTEQQYADLEVQRQTGVVEYEWSNQIEYDTYSLLISTGVSGSGSTQSTYYIHATSGNDAWSGTSSLKPLKTWKELLQRFGRKSVLKPIGNTLTVNLLSNLPDTDPVIFDFTLASGCNAVIKGVKTEVGSGTITAVDNKDQAANQPWTITDSSKSAGYFDDLTRRGMVIEIMTGPGAGSRAYIVKEISTGKAHISEWIGGTNPDGFGDVLGLYQSDPPEVGSTYKIWKYSTMYPGMISIDGDEQLNPIVPTGKYSNVMFINVKANASSCAVGGAYGSPWISTQSKGFTQVGFSDCIIDAAVDCFGGLFTVFWNCRVSGGIQVNTGVVQMFAGLVMSSITTNTQDIYVYPGGIATLKGTEAVVGGDTVFYGEDFYGADLNGVGSYYLGPISIWNSFHGIVSNDGGMVQFGQRGGFDVITGAPMECPLWGINDSPASSKNYLFPQAEYSMYMFRDGKQLATAATLSLPSWVAGTTQGGGGPGGTVFSIDDNWGAVEENSKAHLFLQATGNYTAPIDVTWANFKVAAPAGFLSVQNPIDSGDWGAFQTFGSGCVKPQTGCVIRMIWGQFEPPPSIEAELPDLPVTPDTGPAAGGTAVILKGFNFFPGATVEFDGVTAANIVVVDENTINCDSPAHAAGTVDVVVTNVSGAYSNSSPFIYT